MSILFYKLTGSYPTFIVTLYMQEQSTFNNKINNKDLPITFAEDKSQLRINQISMPQT